MFSSQPTEVRFASFHSGAFITAIVVNPPERKLAKRTSVHCTGTNIGFSLFSNGFHFRITVVSITQDLFRHWYKYWLLCEYNRKVYKGICVKKVDISKFREKKISQKIQKKFQKFQKYLS